MHTRARALRDAESELSKLLAATAGAAFDTAPPNLVYTGPVVGELAGFRSIRACDHHQN